MTGNNLKTEKKWFALGRHPIPGEDALHLNTAGEPLWRYDQVEEEYYDPEEVEDPGDDDYWMGKD